MSPVTPEDKRASSGNAAPVAVGDSHGVEMTCPCCNQPYLRRMVIVECSGCGYRKTESETSAAS